jgi:hypothetical protein
MANKSKKVYVIISGDIDYSEHHKHSDKLMILGSILNIAKDLNVKLSFNFTAKEAMKIDSCVKSLVDAGHEIGCHGLFHNDDEEYNRLSCEKQFQYISEATNILSRITGKDVCSFRAPRVKVSSHMYQILEKLGYLTDSSVCSQRMDLISSNMFNKDWLFAPRLPYNPSPSNPFKKGNSRVLIVPVSALFVPFISSVLYVFGLTCMKMLFSIFYLESLVTGKPIVYLYHPYEFIPEIKGKKNYDSNLKVHGPRWRRHLYRGTPQDKLEKHIKLWRYMKKFKAVEIVTMKQFYNLNKAKGD